MRISGYRITLTAVLILLSAVGCSFLRGNKPQIHRFKLKSGPTATLMVNRAPIELRSVTGLAPYRDTGIAYQTSVYRLDPYVFSRWVAPPVEMVAERLALFVQQPPIGSRSQLPTVLLDADILAFEEIDKAGSISGLVEINFCLRPKHPPSRPQWCHTFRNETPAAMNTRESAVAAISDSFNSVINELAMALNRELQMQPAREPQVETETEQPLHRKQLRSPYDDDMDRLDQ